MAEDNPIKELHSPSPPPVETPAEIPPSDSIPVPSVPMSRFRKLASAVAIFIGTPLLIRSFWDSSTGTLLYIAAGSQMAATFLGAVMGIKQDFTTSQKALVLTIFGILAAIGTSATLRQAAKSSQESNAAQERFSKALNELKSFTTSAQQSSEESARLTRLSAKSLETVMSATRTAKGMLNEIIRETTGSGTYCYFVALQFPHPLAPKENAPDGTTWPLLMIVEGKHPLQSPSAELHIQIGKGQVQPTTVPLRPGSFIPGQYSTGIRLPLGMHFITMTDRTGISTEQIELKSVDGKLVQNIMVFKDGREILRVPPIDKKQ